MKESIDLFSTKVIYKTLDHQDGQQTLSQVATCSFENLFFYSLENSKFWISRVTGPIGGTNAVS